MTTVPIHRPEELDARERDAWAAYRFALDELEGREYEDAEEEAWELLQRSLQEVARDRAAAAVGDAARDEPSFG